LSTDSAATTATGTTFFAASWSGTSSNDANRQHILLRGDTDFSQTAHLDRWDRQKDVQFLFGIDAGQKLKVLAELLDKSAWKPLVRPPRHTVATETRRKPRDVKRKVIAQRHFEHLHLRAEHVAEIEYQPSRCAKPYRLIICRKHIDVEMGQHKLWDEYRYFFYITNDREAQAGQLVLNANQRCDQENLIAQLKGGVHAMDLPVNDLVSNWAGRAGTNGIWPGRSRRGGVWRCRRKRETAATSGMSRSARLCGWSSSASRARSSACRARSSKAAGG
jgi:hypothetical protein